VLASRVRSVVPAGARLTRDAKEATSSWSWYDRAAKTWRQAYVDDPASIAARERFAVGRGLAGIGLWALGYERGQGAYWSAIAAARRAPTAPSGKPAAAAGAAANGAAARHVTPPSMPAVSVRWDASRRAWVARWSSKDAGSGIARYRVEYQVGTGPYRTLAGGLTTSANIRASRWARVRVAVRAIDKAGNASAWGWSTGRR
jgi:hypothetical protein